jgi:hypothetical protein
MTILTGEEIVIESLEQFLRQTNFTRTDILEASDKDPLEMARQSHFDSHDIHSVEEIPDDLARDLTG